MKRIITTALAAAALVVLGACSSAADDTAEPNDSEKTASATTASASEPEMSEAEVVEMIDDFPYLLNPFDGQSEAPPTTFDAALTKCGLTPNQPGVELGDGGYTLAITVVKPERRNKGLIVSDTSCLGRALQMPLHVKSNINHNSAPLNFGGRDSWADITVDWSTSVNPVSMYVTFRQS